MPKAEKLSTKKGAVLARERREREKKDTQYNDALKEFLQLKYNHIIAEFDPMYKNIMARRPANLIYTNTKEFRLWRRREMHKELQPEQPVEQQQAEQPVEQQQQAEQPVEQQQQAEQPVEQQQQAEQPVEQQQQDEQPVEQQQQAEQPVDLEQLVNEIVVDGSNGDDEGIALDLWEELQGDIHDFDYRLEVELEQYMG